MNQLDVMIAAAKQALDKAREDGNATDIVRCMAVLNGRLDRKLEQQKVS